MSSLMTSGPLIERIWGAQATPGGAATVSRDNGVVFDGASHLSFCCSRSPSSDTLAAPWVDFLLHARKRQNAMPDRREAPIV